METSTNKTRVKIFFKVRLIKNEFWFYGWIKISTMNQDKEYNKQFLVREVCAFALWNCNMPTSTGQNCDMKTCHMTANTGFEQWQKFMYNKEKAIIAFKCKWKTQQLQELMSVGSEEWVEGMNRKGNNYTPQ